MNADKSSFFLLIMQLTISTGLSTEFEFVGGTRGGSVTAKEGDRDVVLECSVSSTQDIFFEWNFDHVLIDKDPRRQVMGSSLRLVRVLRKYDTGTFHCVATNTSSGFSLTSPPIRINVIWLSESASVSFSVPEANQDLSPGQEVILECRVEGSLEITFHWFKNGEKVGENSSRIFRVGKRLHISRTTSDDNGSYGCQATSDAGMAESQAPLHLIIKDENVPEIVIPPQSELIPRNSNVQLDCVFSKNAAVEWLFNEDLLQNSTRRSLLSNGTLLIGGVTDSDIGIYKCLTRLGLLASKVTQTYSATLRIASLAPLKLDSLLPKPFSTTHQLGFRAKARAEVYCSPPVGYPPPRVRWEGPQGTLATSKGRIHIRDQDTLVFLELVEEDMGKYTCHVENMAGSSQIAFNLALTSEPRLIGAPAGAMSQEGDSVTFTCQFNGSPFPLSKIQWFHNHEPIRHAHLHKRTNHHHRVTNFEFNGTLVITSVQLGDRGTYVCEVTTEGYPPITARPATLVVIEKLKFISSPVDRRLELGSSYKIPCKAQGDPPPSLNWIKIGQSHFEWPNHIQEENGVLIFQQIQKTDHGEYACVATNIQGVINTTIKIHVSSSPRFTLTPKNPTEAVEGESLTMHCEAEGDPIPTIKWDKDTNTTSIHSDRFLVLENGSLVIREVSREDHNHRFGCTAGNSGGFKREEIQLIVTSNEEYISAEKSGVMTRTVWITLSVAAGYMLLVIGLMLWCRYRQLKRKQTYLADIRGEIGETELKDGLLPPSNGTPRALPAIQESCRESVKSDGETGKSTHSSVTGGKGGSATASVASHRSQGSRHSKRSICTNYEDISGERKDLQFVMLLGHGAFGEVFLAKGKVGSDEERLLMVKALQTKEDGALIDFKAEIDIFYKLNHENVAALLRLSREMDPHYMIMEYSDWGDLKQFLLATRREHPRTPKPPPLTNQQIIQVLCQVAMGMDHLANHRFVHKDLATRNCLVSTGLRVQISSPCLSKDTYANEYFKLRNKVVPLRWLPHEALMEDEYSTKSDVWSFGWVLWEVSTQAAFPLAHLKDEEVAACLQKNELPLKKEIEAVFERLRPLLSQCWDACPRNRPTFSSILLLLQQIKNESETTSHLQK